MAELLILTEDDLSILLENGVDYLILEREMPTIQRIMPVPRNQGVQVPSLLPLADWADSLVLAGGAAESYAVKSDASGNKGVMLRINASVGPLYINANGAATVPVADTTDGSASILIHAELGAILLALPSATDTLSVICPSASVVTIEAWS